MQSYCAIKCILRGTSNLACFRFSDSNYDRATFGQEKVISIMSVSALTAVNLHYVGEFSRKEISLL